MLDAKREGSMRAKEPTAKQTPSIAAIQEMLLPHMLLGGKQSLFNDSLRVATPRCLFDSAKSKRCFVSGPHTGNTTTEVRDALSHDHRCRSATTLYELATTLYRMLEGVQVDNELRLAELKKELAVAKKQSTEWRHHFGSKGVTPMEVELELRSLRQEVEDLRKDKKALEMKVRHHAQHVDCLYQLLPSSAPTTGEGIVR